MTDSKVLIYDYKTLIQLNDAMDYCGDSLLKLLKTVDEYLQSCLRAFEEQRDNLKRQLDREAEELREAENALSDCTSSQEWDEEDKCYRPSCSSERSNVESAKEHYYDCKEKHDKACGIVSDCKHEIEEYKFSGGILRPSGGEKTLEYLAKTHTDEAQAKMNKILELVEKYLGRPLQETEANESLPPTQAQQFKEATEKVQAKQKSESSNIANANVSMVCNDCKRPIPICICAKQREKVR
jgi:hypothetical protein